MAPANNFPKQTFRCGHKVETWRSPAEARKLKCDACANAPKPKRGAKV